MRAPHFTGLWALCALWLLVRPAAAQPAPGAAAAPSELAVSAADSTITYRLVHKMHKFDGVSRAVEGRARIAADGKAQVMVRARVESFDSGNANRDAHMKETVQAAAFPSVELKAIGDVPPPASFPATIERTFHAELTFHGVKKVLEVPVKLTYASATRVRAEAHLSLSLDEFKVERPSLMFIKVDDAMAVDVSVSFAPKG
ncbi:MAG: YceI family protein [Polyangia bacterium]